MKMNNATIYNGVIAASEVVLTAAGTIIVPIVDLELKYDNPHKVDDCIGLVMSPHRYHRLFAGNHGRVTLKFSDDVFSGNRVLPPARMGDYILVEDFVVLGDESYNCPSLEALAAEFKTIETVEKALGGPEAMEAARRSEELARQKAQDYFNNEEVC